MFGKEMHNLKKLDKQVEQKQMWRLTLIPDLLIIPRRVQTRPCSVLFMCYEYSECMQHSFLMYASEKGWKSGLVAGVTYFCAIARPYKLNFRNHVDILIPFLPFLLLQ